MSRLNFSFHLYIRVPSPLLPPPIPSCLLAALSGRDYGWLVPPKLASRMDKEKRNRRFLLNWYFHSVSLLSAWLMFKTDSPSGVILDYLTAHLLGPSDLNSHSVGCAPHSMTTGSHLASRLEAVHPSPDSVGISCHQAKVIYEQKF